MDSRGVPWGALGGPWEIHGSKQCYGSAGSVFFLKSASRCSPSQPTSSRRPNQRLRDAHSPFQAVNYLVSAILKTQPGPALGSRVYLALYLEEYLGFSWGPLGAPWGSMGGPWIKTVLWLQRGARFFLKSASRCSQSQATSSRRPSRRLRDAHSP